MRRGSAGLLGDDPRHDGHRLELLEEQFAGVRHEHLDHLHLLLGGRAAVVPLVEVRDREQAALRAHVHAEGVAVLEGPVPEEGRGAVRDDAVRACAFPRACDVPRWFLYN